MRPSPPSHLSESTVWPGFWIGPDPTRIALAQASSSQFELRSEIWYGGETGLASADASSEVLLRSVAPDTLELTDLASVPSPFRWWVNTYGLHTPAALIHDRFIGNPKEIAALGGVSEQEIDRYFRFMLGSLGVGAVRRWLIWAAVAVRTRLMSGWTQRTLLVTWFIMMLVGLSSLWFAFVGDVSWWLPLALPIPASALWSRQWFAGIIIAYLGVPALLLPAVFALVGIAITVLAEAVNYAVRHVASALQNLGREP